MINLSNTLQRLADQTITITRSSPDTYSGGVRVRGATTTATARASVQPASGEDMKQLPEGTYYSDTIAVFTNYALRTVDEAAGTAADRVTTADGRVFEVANVKPWQNVAGYSHALAVKIKGP
jgi:hypothetical protein